MKNIIIFGREAAEKTSFAEKIKDLFKEEYSIHNMTIAEIMNSNEKGQIICCSGIPLTIEKEIFLLTSDLFKTYLGSKEIVKYINANKTSIYFEINASKYCFHCNEFSKVEDFNEECCPKCGMDDLPF